MTTSRVTTQNDTVKRTVKTVSMPVVSASSVPSLGIKLKSGLNINDPALLVSPLATLAAFRAGNPFLGLQDRAHAYNTLHMRLRMLITECAMQKVPLASFSSLDSVKPIIGRTGIITDALAGDLHYKTIDPRKHTNVHPTEDHSLDVLFDAVPSSEPGSDVSEDEESLLARANQAPGTTLAALTVVGDIFTTPVCSLFSHENLICLLTVLTALFSPSGEDLPIAQTSRIRATAMWILAHCRLPPEICRSCLGHIVVSIRCALIMRNVDGPYRARHKALWLDALKAVERFRRSHESDFLAPIASQILPSVLSHLTPRTSGTNSKMQDDLEIRFEALGFMQSFSPTLLKLSETHSDRDQVSLGAAKKMAAKSIHDYLISSSSLTQKYLTQVDSKSSLPPLQVLITLSCLIISSSQHIFAHSSLGFILPLMSQLGNHERSTVRVVARWVWRCLCFCATQVEPMEKRKTAVEVCCGILDEGIGVSFVAALKPHELSIVLERMLHSPPPNKPPTTQTRTEAMRLVARLTSVPASSTRKREWSRGRLITPLLFSPKLLSPSLSETGAKNLISEAREKGKIEFANINDVEPVPLGETREAIDMFMQDVVGILSVAVSVSLAKEEKEWCAVLERFVPKIWNSILERYRLVHRRLSKSPEKHSSVQHDISDTQRLASSFRHLLHTLLTTKTTSLPLHVRLRLTRLLTCSTASSAFALRQEADWKWIPEVIHYLLFLLSECPLHRYEDPITMKEWIRLVLCLKSECAKWCHPREVDEEREITISRPEESGSQSDVESSSVDLLSQVAAIEDKIHGVLSGSVQAYDWERLLRSFLLDLAESEMDVTEWIGYVFQRVFEAINDEDMPRTSEYFDLVKCTQRLALAFSYTPRFALLEMLAYALQYAYEIDDGRHSDFETRIALWDIASDMLGSVDVAEEGQQLVDILIVLQEPVGVWLRDQYWKFKDAEYAQLLPFYNRALTFLTLLPPDGITDAPNGITVDILNELAPLLTSVFLHETTPVKAAGPIAFMDFWADHCGHIYEGDFETLERGLKKALGALGKWGLEVPEAWIGWGDGDEDSDISVVPGTLSDEEDHFKVGVPLSCSLAAMTAVSSVIPSPSPPPEILPTPSSLHSHTCVLCNKPTSLTCPECGNEYYCSEEHKVLDRPRHQFACASRASFNELASRWLNDTSGQDNEGRGESLNEARTRSSRRNQSVSSKSESTVRPRAHTNRTKTGTRTGTPPTTDAGNDPEENEIIEDEEEGVMEPISTPSQLRSRPQTRRTTHSQPPKHPSKHKPPGVTVKAFMFPCAPPARPEIMDVTCTTLDTPFENTHHRPSFRVPLGLAKDQEVAFNTIPTYRGLFLLIRPVDVNQEMPVNECISNIIMIEGGGPQEHVWRGNVLVLKESDPRSGLFGDVQEDDLDVLGAYFRLDGKVSLNSLTRTLNLPPSNPTFQLPPPSPSTTPAETEAETSTSEPSGNGYPFPRVHSHTPILRPMAPTPGLSTPHPRSSGSHPRTSGSRHGSGSRSRSRSRPESIIASLPIPQIPAAIIVDTILLPPASPHPHILPLPCSPHILRPPRQVYESVLGPDPIFRRIETWAGDFLVGCRPRFAFEEDEDEEEGEGAGGNVCVRSLTNGRGSWKDWPGENILVVKLRGPYDPLPPPIPAEPGVGVRLAAVGAKNASMFDLAPLRRFFEFSGSMSESALKDFLSRP